MVSTSSSNAQSVIEQQTLPASMVERMTLILDLFDRPHICLPLERVARLTHLPRSTAHRILDQLVRMQWLERVDDSYRLGPRSLALGGREIGHGALRAAAAPVLHQLAIYTGLVVHLAILDGTEVYYLDKIGGRRALHVPSRVGGRVPAHRTALGKAILAWHLPEHVDHEYAHAPDHTRPLNLTRLHTELGHIRRHHGIAYETGETYPGIICAAIALRSPDQPVAAISLTSDTDAPLARLAPQLAGAANAISNQLFAGPRATAHRPGTPRSGHAVPMSATAVSDEAPAWTRLDVG